MFAFIRWSFIGLNLLKHTFIEINLLKLLTIKLQPIKVQIPMNNNGLGLAHMASSHNFNSQHFKSRVSNPISKCMKFRVKPQSINHYSQETYAYKNSKPQGLEETTKHELLKTDRAKRWTWLGTFFARTPLLLTEVWRGGGEGVCIMCIYIYIYASIS